MKKVWHDKAWEEYLYWQTQDKKTLKKINKLLTDIDRNGYNCTGKPEPLKENLSGYWSVRIDEQNRIVFRINGELLEIMQCGSITVINNHFPALKKGRFFIKFHRITVSS